MSDSIDAILNPRALAIVGASNEPGKRGYRAVATLLRDHYAGEIFPVNPGESEVLGLRCYPSIDVIGMPIDVALVCTPAHTLPGVIGQCVRAGVKGAVVVSGGFSEAGEAGRALEARCVELARRAGVRIVGPNMNGIFSRRFNCNTSPWKDIPVGDIAVLSNSANVGHWLLTKAWDHGAIGFSTLLSVGNQADVQFHEYLASLGDDPDTHAIVCYIEGFGDGRAFLDTARRVALRKPIVVYKAGRNAEGARMARSHSGSLAGSHSVAKGVLRQAGVTVVNRAEHLLPVAEALSRLPHMRSRRVAVISEGGGPITIAAEALVERGLILAPLSEAAQAKIHAVIPASTTIANPVDIAVLTNPLVQYYGLCARAILEDPGIDALLFVGWFGAYGLRGSDAVAAEEKRVAADLGNWMKELGKPVVVQSHYARFRTEALQALRDSGVPFYHDFDDAVECLRAAAEYGEMRRRLGENASLALAAAAPRVREGIDRCRAEGRTALLETEAREVLGAAGITIPEHGFARTPGDLADIAARFSGQRLAMKVVAEGIVHKSDAGGVRLGIEGESALRAAWEEIMSNAARVAPEALVKGVLVTPMAAPGVEVIVGVTRDPQFGPVILFGLGGIFVEVMRDAAFRALPISAADAGQLLGEIRARVVLDGVRGAPAVDRQALIDLLLGISRFVQACPEIEEIDLNPVIAHGQGCTIVDVRMVLNTKEHS